MSHPRRDIDRYLAEGLPVDAEQTLRRHLRACEECRCLYDGDLRLRRALAGAPSIPTRAEEVRLRRLILARSGLTEPFSASIRTPRRSLMERFGADSWQIALPIAAAALALFVGLWLIYPWHATPLPSNPQQGTLIEPVLAARVLLARDVAIDGAPAKAGTPILSGTAVVVSADGLAELELLRGGRARLFPRTRIKLKPRGEVLVLEDGTVWCDVEPARGRFVVSTVRGEARALGTSFIVEEPKGGDTDVRVLSGVVEVEDAGHHGTVRIKGGERTRLPSGGAPLRVLRYDTEADRADWEIAFRQLGRELERSFRKLGDRLQRP